VPCFTRELQNKLEIGYAGEGRHIAENFYIPVLKLSKKYDRISGYFSIDSLVITATGIAGLINNGGSMRLILGAHDLGPDVETAYKLSKERAQELVETIGQRIANNLDTIEDVIAKRRLEALAWMLVEKKLEIKVAIPRKTFLGAGNGIFHEKSLVFEDEDGCRITAGGSTNESRSAWEVNGENINVFPSWNPGVSEYINRHREQFDVLWNNNHKDYYSFSLPRAIEEKLSQKFYTGQRPRYDPLDHLRPSKDENRLATLKPAAEMILQLGSVKGLAHLGLGPVSLYPHQAYAVEQVLKRFPYRALLADEVGLGKTLEAGAIIKRLLDNGRISRVCILTPKNVAKQWLDEMWNRFTLNFSMLQSNPRRFVNADKEESLLFDTENPFDSPDHKLVIASWHYARGSKKRSQEILHASKFFDLIVIDEAHAARKRWSEEPPTPTKLKALADELSATSPHLILMTATPVQLNELEALDMLEILGLGGKWVHDSNFTRYYETIRREPANVELADWAFALEMASYIAIRYIAEDDVRRMVEETFGHLGRSETSKVIGMLKSGKFDLAIIKTIMEKDPSAFRRLLIALNPMNWFMIRNTRDKLRKMGYTFPERNVMEEDLHLDQENQDLLDELDDYLRGHYGKYERVVAPENKGIIGFVRSIYHQRFVSSFAAAHATITNRLSFLEAVLRGDEDAMGRLAEKMLADEEDDQDEDDIIEHMKRIVEHNRDMIREEIDVLGRLASKLLPYSPDHMSRDDPKLDKVFEITNAHVSAGRKVLIFSKYTDTVDAIRRFLARKGVRNSRMGTYTGDGGQLYDLSANKFISCGKEDVRKALDNDEIDLLVCSDAAAEGLNLQSASVIINADMPWNPAKVEQRIGRVDRLGQKASEVTVVNVWYPETIEAKMYKMLFERKEIYKLVVGPAQEIVSSELKKSLDIGARGADLDKIVTEVQNRIQDEQNAVVEREGILEGLSWSGHKEDDSHAVRVTFEFVKTACERLGIGCKVKDGRVYIEIKGRYKDVEKWNGASLTPGNPNTLTPSHPIVTVLAEDILFTPSDRAGTKTDFSVYTVKNHEGLRDLLYIESGVAAERKKGGDALDVFEKLLESAKN
jgi:superfamily II DNA or RNA helicase